MWVCSVREWQNTRHKPLPRRNCYWVASMIERIGSGCTSNPMRVLICLTAPGGISARNDHVRDLYFGFPLHILLAILCDIADCFSANSTVVAGIVNGQPSRNYSMAGSDETRLDRHRFSENFWLWLLFECHSHMQFCGWCFCLIWSKMSRGSTSTPQKFYRLIKK